SSPTRVALRRLYRARAASRATRSNLPFGFFRVRLQRAATVAFGVLPLSATITHRSVLLLRLLPPERRRPRASETAGSSPLTMQRRSSIYRPAEANTASP